MRKTLPLQIESGLPFVIRPERASEFLTIHEFIRKAFETAHYAEGDEQDFVDERRRTDTYVPELALLLEAGDRIVAHLMLTRISISTASGPLPILLLACVAVDAEHRNRGVGSVFIERALRRAATLGHAAVILLGDPAYYRRIGFVSSELFGVSSENGVEARYVQMRELTPGARAGVSGSIKLPS
nr:N-acetyltransferase [Methylosinus sp. Ce-a6]